MATAEYIEYTCDVCENMGMCCDGSRPMLTSFGLNVCSTGCAMRAWKFGRCIDPKYNHTVTRESLDSITEYSFLMRIKRCDCGCNESYSYDSVEHYECISRHLKKDVIIELNNDEIYEETYGRKCIYKCEDCGKGLMKYQKKIIEEIRKSSINY